MLQEKEAIEASVKILTAAQHAAKSPVKPVNKFEPEGSRQGESDVKDGSLSDCESQVSDTDSEGGRHRVAVQSHPLASSEDDTTSEKAGKPQVGEISLGQQKVIKPVVCCKGR